MIITCEIESAEEWDNFIYKLKPNTFLQAWNWGEMQKSLGEKVCHVAAYENDVLVGVAMGISVTAKRGKFLFCPHGPLVAGNRLDVRSVLINTLRDYSKKHGYSFLRVSPLEFVTDENKNFYKKNNFRPAPIHMHAETMWCLDIKPSEEELLRGMRKTTRNLVRRAEKDGVKIKISRDKKDLSKFETVYNETADRENFVGFSKKYLETEFETLRQDGKAFLVFAEYGLDVISTALIVVCGNTGFYHQGASTRKWAKVPGAYLLQWEIIKHLKQLGLERYNFWGIAPNNDPKHPWAGLSLFKQGFGGYCENYLHAQDLPLKPQYFITYIVELIRRIKRGY